MEFSIKINLSFGAKKKAEEKRENVYVEDVVRLFSDNIVFCIYTFGIPFVDIVQLKPENISDGRLSYTRQKTGQQITVSLLPEAESIIKRYVVADGASLFPFISKFDDYSRYQYELTKYNKALKEIAKLANVQKELTSYVARHTWASLALQAGVQPSVISQALGHTNLRTTEIYLKQLDITQIAEAGTSVVNYIFH